MMIRELQKSDIPELAALAAKTFAETFAHGFTSEELETEIKETRSESYFQSVSDTDTILVAAAEDRLAGYIQLSDIKKRIKGVVPGMRDQAVNAIYIHSDYQGQGLGRMLMDAAFAHPRFQNAENIFIDVWDKNKRAVDFYLNYGFAIAGTYDVVVGGKIIGEDLVLRCSARKGDM